MYIFKDSTAFTFDRAAWIKTLKGGGFAAAGAFVTYFVAHVGDLNLGPYGPLATALFTWFAHAVSAWVLPSPDPAPTPVPTPTIINIDPGTGRPVKDIHT
jgi:hypothetical protein